MAASRGTSGTVKKSMAAGVVALILALSAGSADAGVFWSVSYTPSAITTMLKAVRYPRAHLRRLSCSGLAENVDGRYGSFRCVARWRQDGHTVFYAAGAGDGGWLCVGSSVAGCKVLNRGYAPKPGPNVTPSDIAEVAAHGYLQNHFHRVNAPMTIPPCRETATSVWTCGYQLSGPPALPVEISITLIAGLGGWVVTGALADGASPPY